MDVNNPDKDPTGAGATINRGQGTFALTNATASNTVADTKLGGRTLKILNTQFIYQYQDKFKTLILFLMIAVN